MSQESNIVLPPDSDGKRVRALNYTLSGQNATQSVWAEVHHIGDPQSGAYLALVNASGALSVSTSGDAVSVSGNIVGVYAASQQSGWMAVVSGVQATSGALIVSSSGLATVAISSGGVIPVMAASFQSGWAAVVSGVGATSGQLNVASSGIGAVAIASGGIIPISIISGNVVALSGIVEIVSGQTVTVVSSGIGTIAVSSGGVIPTILASAQSGGLVGISGGGLTISGGVTVSGLVVISGFVAISGSVTVLPNAYQSGQLVALSGGGAGISGVAVSVSGNIILVVSGGTLPVLISGNATVWLQDSNGATAGAIVVGNFPLLFGGSVSDRTRSVVGASGVISALGIQATLPAPWTYKNVSGAVISNIWQSGAVFVHAININDYSSGLTFRIRDSQSGAAGTIVATVAPFGAGLAVTDLPPTTLPYDALFTNGLVIDTSGTGWDLTVFYRGLLS